MAESGEKNSENDDAAVVEVNGQSGSARDADFSVLDKEESNSSVVDSTAGSEHVGKLKADLASEKDQHLRTLAEFDNFRKRAIKERSELLKYQGEKAFQDLLDIQDNFELALKHADADPANLKQGVALIHKLFVEFFKKWEIKAESAVGQEFDPSKHSAISRVESKDARPGTVINELKKAYFYKDKLLRPAEVVVAASTQEQSEDNEKPEERSEQVPEDKQD